MNTIDTGQVTFFLLGAVLVFFLAHRAWNHGVTTMFVAIISASAGLVAGYVLYQNAGDWIERAFPDRYLPPPAVLAVAFFSGLILYLLVRVMMSSFFGWLFNPDGMLSGWGYGFRGAFLSLFPSLVTLLIVITCIRMAGTLTQIYQFEKIAKTETKYSSKNFPKQTITARWRNSLERLPLVLPVLDPVDQISRINERKLVEALITTQSDGLYLYARDKTFAKLLYKQEAFESLAKNPDLRELMAARNYLVMLQHPDIAAAADDPNIQEALEDISFYRMYQSYFAETEEARDLKIFSD